MTKSKTPKLPALLPVLIPLLKFLLFLRRFLGRFLFWLIIKPVIFVLKIFFYRPLVKIYGIYILSHRKVREIKKWQSPQIFIWKKFATPIILSLLAIIVIANDAISQSHQDNFDNRMTKVIAATLIKNEFDLAAAEELITETANPNCLTAPEKYWNSSLVLETPLKAWTVSPPNIEPDTQSCLAGNVPALIKNVIINNAPSTAERTSVVEYTVKTGDTVSSVAKSFGINSNTVLLANNLSAYSILRAGQKLRILPQSGVLYKVKSGDTLSSIANKHGVTSDKISLANNLGERTLKIGEELFIPGATKIISPVTAIRSTQNSRESGAAAIKNIVKPGNVTPVTGRWQWPTGGYRISQYFSWRHTGLDIANKVGTPLYAAESGVVEKSGWNSSGYGNMILINVGSGKKIRYGHASKLYVVAGEEVVKGQVIGLMGSTGRSTGPHLHFEVIINGQHVNPLNYIR